MNKSGRLEVRTIEILSPSRVSQLDAADHHETYSPILVTEKKALRQIKTYMDEMCRLGLPEGALAPLRAFRTSLKESMNHSKRITLNETMNHSQE